MKKCLYSGARVYEIFSSLQRRGLAMFLGFQNGEPMIWMDLHSPLARSPISIATAEVILEEVLTRELEGVFEVEVLIGEVLDSLPAVRGRSRPTARPRRLREVALIAGVV